MRQPWRLKAISFQILRCMPKSVYDLLTVYVTRRGTRRIMGRSLANADRHAEALAAGMDIQKDTLLEFGAGKDLLNNFLLFQKGFRKQVTVDVRANVRPYYLNNILEQEPLAGLGLDRFNNDFRSQLRCVGIDYWAPCDMRATAFPAGSIAAVMSTNTLEHVPLDDITKIMREILRVLRPGGLCSLVIDYSDHYSHTDCKIHEYNFLRYSGSAWRLMSPPNHYQNRLRHSDYVRIFQDAGFEVRIKEAFSPSDWRQKLTTIKPAREFAHLTREELSFTGGWFVLGKPRDISPALSG